MTTKRRSHFRVATILAGAACLVVASTATSNVTLFRIAATQQKAGERATAAGIPGVLKYSNTFFNSGERTYVTVIGQGDTHGGAALRMNCTFDGAPCEVGFGADSVAASGWKTLNKLPTSSGNTNCNDGGGGSADCHDNTIAATWCIHNFPGVHTVQLFLASSVPGQTVFYEKLDIYIDGSSWHPEIRCQNPGVAAEVPPLPGDFSADD